MRQNLAWWIGVTLAAVAGCGGEPTEPADQPPMNLPGGQAGSATLSIRVSTQGIAPGVETFSVRVDGIDVAAPTNGAVSRTVATGTHRVELHDLPRFCQVRLQGSLATRAWSSSRAVEVYRGQTVTVPFDVICSETGTLRFETRTTGNAPTLLIATLPNHPHWLIELPPSGALAVPDVFVGAYSVHVTAGPRCTGDPTATLQTVEREVQVRANAVDTLRFEFACR